MPLCLGDLVSESEIWSREYGIAIVPDYNPRHVFSVPWSPANVVYRSFLRGPHWPGCRNCLRVSMAALEEEILDNRKAESRRVRPFSFLAQQRRGARLRLIILFDSSGSSLW